MKKKISFQGVAGAYSHMACQNAAPDHEPLPCVDFESAIAAVYSGDAACAMIPVDNSIAGRVADIHHLLPKSNLFIVGEHFQPIEHYLLGTFDSELADIKTVTSHPHALPQCRNIIRKHKWSPVVSFDTAAAAQMVADKKDKTIAAIASKMAADLYGLRILAENIADTGHNTTRFVIMQPTEIIPPVGVGRVMTSLVFRVRSVPAALYKALGGFATNGINLTKIESYSLDGVFDAAEFYAEIEGHPESGAMQLALEELRHFSHSVKLLGVYAAHPFRLTNPVGAVLD